MQQQTETALEENN